ncbi:methyl-accepting chemotaxis protein [Desulfosporosinus sp. PR]|uniref:methyl-accepting chemotaxis protein n=1 Tax=Candidatus Desulfosporosinus nitrosoreducens TaxID=3401928 RepID=UPI0027E640DB|nr:methyl-accepting chemotaxis protein [Desulfosporosinus sp. PR]MDQ7094276.1 methyl-accepting chemotaxis protein [Desulfosporosinus sp. PR]
MKLLKNKRIVMKLGVLIGLMSVFLAVISIIGYVFFSQAGNFVNQFYSDNLISVQTVNQARSDSNALKSAALALTSYTLDDATKKAQLDQIETRESSIDKFIKDFEPLATTAYEAERLSKLKNDFQSIKEITKKAINYSQAGNKAEAQEYYLKNGFSKQDDFQTLLREIGTFNIEEANNKVVSENRTIIFVKTTLLVLPIIVIIAAIFVGLVITRMITVPIKGVVANITEIAKGNLTIEALFVDSKDEIGILADNLNIMSANIKALITQVTNSAEQLASSSEELTASVEQQAQATSQVALAVQHVATETEKQSNSINETSSAVEQMTTAIHEMAANSYQAAEQANNTSLVANEGQGVIRKAVSQMEKVGHVTAEVQVAVDQLERGSNKIGEITNVISGIAAQTNLLALNAAIEAARAGDQGRGFAVVAEEVRKLAEQSQDAAQEIASLINENQTNIHNAVDTMKMGTAGVKEGIEIVSKAGETFAQIAGAINQVVVQIQNVSATVKEMAGSSQLVLTSINQIESISKDNMGQTQSVSAATEEQSASGEQIAAASQSLAEMAQDLQLVVNKFRV